MSFHATILTLFPEMFPGALGHSVIGRALQAGIWSYEALQIRDFAGGKHFKVDDTPYGGGAGLVMRADVIGRALQAAKDKQPAARILYLSPRGKPLTQAFARELAAEPALTLLCGRYEGVDNRVIEHFGAEEVSIGDYVLAGGEVAAQVLLEAVLRLLPDVLGAHESAEEESFTIGANSAGLLEYPHYTKPPIWEGREVPELLRSGHHERIENWRLQQSEALTQARRPDMWQQYLAQLGAQDEGS